MTPSGSKGSRTAARSATRRARKRCCGGPPRCAPRSSTPAPADVGLLLGSSRGEGCWASVEDSITLLGPPRAGKGFNIVIPAILDYPGAVITTSTRPDNLAPTLEARSKVGPVAVFDPEGLAAGVPSALRWSPVRGCERAQTAMIRAAALTAGAGQGVTEANYWKEQTRQAVRCLLHAAAIGGRSADSLYEWSLSAPGAKEAVQILMNHPAAARKWSIALDAIISSDPKRRDDIWSMVSNAFSALADPKVLAAVSPGPDEHFDPARFLREQGTLYLLGTAGSKEATGTAGLVSALIEDVVNVARRLAAGSPGSRLDPPLGLILDEAANYPLPSLAALMSEGGGTGITTLAVLQTLAQARHRWGRDEAQAIWDSSIAKLILGGGSDADDLADLSRMIGDRTVRERSESWGTGRGYQLQRIGPPAGHLGPGDDPGAALRVRADAAALGEADHAPAAPLDRPARRRRDRDRQGQDRNRHPRNRRPGMGKRIGGRAVTADRRLVLLGYAVFGCAAGSEFFYWVWTPSRWLPWLAMTATAVMLFAAGLSMAVRSCR